MYYSGDTVKVNKTVFCSMKLTFYWKKTDNKHTHRRMLQNKPLPDLLRAGCIEEDRSRGACPSSAPPE